MASEIDLFLLEKQAGIQFSNRLKRNLIASIKAKVNKGSTGMALKSNVKPFFKNQLLDRITITTPYYIFPILHIGFEGTKKNGVNARLEARKFITDAVENGKLVEDLANIIGDQRADAIVSRINFSI